MNILSKSSTLNVAVLQMTSIDEIESNVQFIEKAVQNLDPNQTLDLICLPENCLYLRIKEGDPIPRLSLDHPAFKRLAAISKSRHSFLHLGSVPIEIQGKLFNSSVLVTPSGEIISSYQKIHLFDIHLEGRSPNRESDIFSPGADPHVFEIKGWKIGESICYDVRFSELYYRYAKQEVDVILIPAAFLVETGKAHWEILLRARAIESQAYVIAAAQAGTHRNSSGACRETYGHSMIIGPWGNIKVSLKSNPEMILLQLKKEEIVKVRTQIPMCMHRRL